MAAGQETFTVVQPGLAAPARAGGLAVPGRIVVERVGRSVAKAGLLVSMVVGCVALVTAIPAAWLWIGSQLTDSYIFPPGYVYLLLGIGIPASMALGGKLLCCVGALYERVRGTTVRSVPDAWRRSRNESRGSHEPVTALDVIASVVGAGAVIALLAYIGLDLIGPVIQ